MFFQIVNRDILCLPEVQSVPWWHTHFRPSPVDSTELSAYQQSSDPASRQPCPLLKTQQWFPSWTESSLIKNSIHLQTVVPKLLTLCAIRLSLLLTLLLLELHVTMVEHCTSHLVDAQLLFIWEAQDINSILNIKDAQNIILLENQLKQTVFI